MAETPTPGPQRSITEGTPVRMPIGRFVAILIGTSAAAATAAAWAMDLSRGQAESLRVQAAQTQAMDEVRQWMRTCDRRLYNVEAAVGAKPLARLQGPGMDGSP